MSVAYDKVTTAIQRGRVGIYYVPGPMLAALQVLFGHLGKELGAKMLLVREIKHQTSCYDMSIYTPCLHWAHWSFEIELKERNLVQVLGLTIAVVFDICLGNIHVFS